MMIDARPTFQVGRLGVTGSRSDVLHRVALPPREWSAACVSRGGRRFLLLTASEDEMLLGFPERRLCRSCAALSNATTTTTTETVDD